MKKIILLLALFLGFGLNQSVTAQNLGSEVEKAAQYAQKLDKMTDYFKTANVAAAAKSSILDKISSTKNDLLKMKNEITDKAAFKKRKKALVSSMMGTIKNKLTPTELKSFQSWKKASFGK